MRLKSRQRKALPTKDFAGPGRSFPIENRGHAKAALEDADLYASPKTRKRVDAAVRRKYPGMK